MAETWVHVGIAAAAQRYLSSPQNLLVLPDPRARLPPEQKLEIREVGIQRDCCSELMASHGRTQPGGCRVELFGQGRGCSACSGSSGGRGWLCFTRAGRRLQDHTGQLDLESKMFIWKEE